MKINFNVGVVTIRNQPVTLGDKGATLGDLCVAALNFLTPEMSQRMNPEDSLRRYRLAKKIENGGEVELTASEVTFIQECAGKMYLPFVYGSLVELLEQGEAKP